MSEQRLLEDDIAVQDVAGPDASSLEPSPAAEPASSATVDEFEQALAEFDAAIPQPAPAPEPPAPEAAEQVDVDALLEQHDREQVDRDARVQQRLAQIQQQQLFEHADAVGNRIKDQVFSRYKDTHIVDKELLDSWMETTANNDPELKQAFINAIVDPRGRGDSWGRTNAQIFDIHYSRLLTRLDQKLAPQKRDNIAANEDRQAVVAAVLRGGSTGRHAPEEPPVDYGKLDNSEMREEIKRLGFDPGF